MVFFSFFFEYTTGTLLNPHPGILKKNGKNTVGAPNLSTTPYRTLPFSVRIFITLAVTSREAYRTFSLKFSVLQLKNSKTRTVPYLK